MCAGIKELVLRQYFRWYPIEGVLDAVVVWPAVDIANKEQLVHGMEDVFVIWEEENAGNWCWPCIPIDADNWATFPETHPVYGRDAHGNILQNESRTSRLWHTAKLLRETISDLTRTALSLRSGAVIVCFKPFTSLAYDLLGIILVFCENLFVEPCGIG